ncbi:MAG: N-acetyltransferase [Gammaproteobacteria bacterium]|nr:N-acetyltransferase [Gammaproteobacteria bacterium]
MTARVARSLADVDATQWNALVGRGTPFLRHEFLVALEQSGCATAETGWDAHHLLLSDSHGDLTGAMPLYLKPHSWGEFVFDFAWAEAYQRAGLSYYPRLCSAVPFTPATGPRLLTLEKDAAASRLALIGAARQLASAIGVSSLHVLFPDSQDKSELEAAGWMTRLDCQFHWHNAGYGSFDDFIAGFTAEKRKKVRRERRRVAEAGITHRTLHGDELDAALMNTVYTLHAQTFARFGNPPYLNLDFFRRLARSMPRALVVELAMRHDEVIACSLSLRSDDTLYGRYWGASGDYNSLHFETCLYRGIEYCIREGLARFEPGTQGEHKLLRGFAPAPVWSLHEIADPRFAVAIRDWLKRERSRRRAYLQAAADHLPFRRADIQARLSVDVRDCLAAED